jgi:hypothetical protein
MTEQGKQATISSFRANVSRQEAVRAFGGSGLDAIYWRARRGQLTRVALAYVPFRLYRVQYELGSARHSRVFAMEAVEGTLDLFEFPSAPLSDQLQSVETRNFVTPKLAEDRAEALLREKVLRIVFQNGFFRVREPRLRIECLPGDFNLPYWLGFYGSESRLHCRVMDAVRRRMEGGKATALFERWLAA